MSLKSVENIEHGRDCMISEKERIFEMYDPAGDAAIEILAALTDDESHSKDWRAVKSIIEKHWKRPPVFKDDSFGIMARHWAITQAALSVARTFRELGGENYVTFDFEGTEAGTLSITIQRKGAKGPAEAIGELVEMLRGCAGCEPDARFRAAKWLAEHDEMRAEKEPGIRRFRDAQREVQEFYSPWWRRLARRFEATLLGRNRR